MTAPVLTVNSLGLRAGEVALVAGASLSLGAGELVAIIGPNGAGKTSLLRAISGDLAAHVGEITLGGVAIEHWSRQSRARSVAVLPQQSTLAFPFSAEEVVQLGRIPHASGHRIDAEILREVAALLDMTHLLDRPYPLLSGGEKQRVQLARVLVQIWRPGDVVPAAGAAPVRVLLLDEPNASQDIGHQQLVMTVVQHCAARGVGVLMVEHDVGLAAHYADRILAMRGGAVVADGAPAQVISEATMKSVFNADMGVQINTHTGRPLLVRLESHENKGV